MPTTSSKLRFWAPRVLGILFAVFISLFALDVFGEGFSIVALFMHLVPTLCIVFALALAWRRAWVGAILFPALGLVWLAFTRFSSPLSVYLIIVGPPMAIGALFLVDWLKRPVPAPGAHA